MHRRLLMAAFAAVALAAVAAPLASAVEPTRYTIDEFVEGYVLYPGESCEFEVVTGWHSVGDEVHFYDQAGDVVRADVTIFILQWWTANGKTVISNWQRSNLTTYDPWSDAQGDLGRYITWRFSDTRLFLADGTLIGKGPGGRITLDFATDPLTLTFTPGTTKGTKPSNICEALAP